ncbi:hypothetical protein [Planctomycetes bacterium Pan216]
MSETPPKKKQANVGGWTVSIVVHVVILGVLAFWVISQATDEDATQISVDGGNASVSTPGKGDAIGGANISSGNLGKKVKEKIPKDAEIAEMITLFINRTDRQSDNRKIKTLEERLEQLKGMSSEESVRQIGGVIQQALSTGIRAYSPVEPAPKGPFDVETGIIYKAISKKGPSGEETFYVLVDKDGRTMEVAAGKSDSAAVKALNLMGGSPLFQEVLHEAVLPVVDRFTWSQAPAATQPAQPKASPAKSKDAGDKKEEKKK